MQLAQARQQHVDLDRLARHGVRAYHGPRAPALAPRAPSPRRRGSALEPPGMTTPTGLQRYQIMEALGAGSQGQTFRGIDRVTGQSVAIKVLQLKNLGGDWKPFDLFERECQVLRDLSTRRSRATSTSSPATPPASSSW
jgi:hypothetical protein